MNDLIGNLDAMFSCKAATEARRAARVALCAAGFLAFGALLLAAPGEDGAMFRGNLRHSGEYRGAGVARLHGVKWSFHLPGEIISSPAVDGTTVYAASTGGMVYAVDRETGKEKWEFAVKSRVVSSPAVAGGTVFFEAYDGYFYALDAGKGELKWKFKTGGEHRFTAKGLHGMLPVDETKPDPWDDFLSSPAVWEWRVYFGSGDGNVYALDANTGKLVWKFQTGNVVHASPAIADGMVFIGSWDRYFYALDARTGEKKWAAMTGDDPAMHNHVGIESSAAVVDGTVYFGCRDAHVYALDEMTGKEKWVFTEKNGSWVNNSPAVSKGVVYFGNSYGGELFAADAATGKILYTVSFNGWPLYSSPAVAGDRLYIGSTDGTLNAVDLEAKKIAWTFATEASKKNLPAFTNADGSGGYFDAFTSTKGYFDDTIVVLHELNALGPVISSPVVVDNAVYFGASDGNLYALE
jgi:outer membrane protein assembly factor BamB